jgi:asparagine synthase (glutamine-hydrolysing)
MPALERINLWLQERKLGKDARSVRRDRLTYLTTSKLLRLEEVARTIASRKIPGDILEFGVAMGGTAIVLAGKAGQGRRFHGFDVFAMIPPPTSEKDDDKSKERYEVISSGRSQGIDGDRYYGYRDDLYEFVKANFAKYGYSVDGEKIQLHAGLFENTWPTVDIKQIALAHIDCDWYDPVKYCLEAVADKVSIGGMLVIDDYHDYGGAKTAVDEFLASNSNFLFEDGSNPILKKVH